MNQAEFNAIPVTDKLMFGEVRVLDECDEWWWIGMIDGKPHRRPVIPHFACATFVVTSGSKSDKVVIPFLGQPDERLWQAAAQWAANRFGCCVDDVVVASSS